MKKKSEQPNKANIHQLFRELADSSIYHHPDLVLLDEQIGTLEAELLNDTTLKGLKRRREKLYTKLHAKAQARSARVAKVRRRRSA